MRILVLTPQLPYPPHQGTSLRNYHILRGLAERHVITLLSFVDAGQAVDEEAIQPLLALCERMRTVPAPPARTHAQRLGQLLTSRRTDIEQRLRSDVFDIALRRLLSETQFDVVQIEGLELAPRMATVREAQPRARLVFDAHNAETALQERALEADRGNWRRLAAFGYSWVQVGRLRRLERWACLTADGVTAVSENDRAQLEQLAPALRGQIHVIPNCLDVASYDLTGVVVPPECRFDLLFSGKMDYRPNIDAVLWFADAVWPRIVAHRPQTTWAIVGQKPHPRLERLRQLPGVTVTGWVEEVRPYLAGTAVYVMPFRVGSGTRLKLIEAMAARKAIVSTRLGAEGFPARHEQELLLIDDPAAMATAVLTLLDDPDERVRLGAAAHQFAQQYDWRRVIPRFEALYQSL